MGYFSNGCEGSDYEERYCSRCIHRPDYDKLIDCPILTLHSMWNYDAVGKNADAVKKTVLDTFIPQTADGLENEQCRMFVERRTA
jgi:hypothetical protein